MTKKPDYYCEAMNAIASGKVSLFNGGRYKKALRNIPAGMDQSPASYQELFLSREKLNTEIERQKEMVWSIAKPLLLTIIGGVIVGIILSFLK